MNTKMTDKEELNQMIHILGERIYEETKKGNVKEAHRLALLADQLIDQYMELMGIEL